MKIKTDHKKKLYYCTTLRHSTHNVKKVSKHTCNMLTHM